MAGFSPTLNVPHLKRKGLMTLFGGVKAPFYTPSEVFLEGQPLKHDSAGGQKVLKAGSLEGALVFGLALQETYTQSDPRLKGMRFPNDTRQELSDGVKIGVLMGHGFAQTLNYKGTISEGDQLYYDPADGKLIASGAAAVTGNKLPIRARTGSAGTGGTGISVPTLPNYITIEFDFPTVTL